jgi:O-antigen/teichoic acid export membrane protein
MALDRVRHPVITNSLALLGVRGSLVLSRLIVLFLVAAFVTPEIFGLVSYAIAIGEIGKIVADFGVDTWATREYAASADSRSYNDIAIKVTRIRVIVTPIVYVCAVAMFWLTTVHSHFDIGVVANSLILSTLFVNFSLSYFQAKLRVREIVLTILPLTLLSIGLAAVLMSYTRNPLLALLILPATECAAGVILLRKLHREIGRLNGIFNRQFLAADITRTLIQTFPIALTGILVILYSRLDVIVLSRITDARSVGLYSVANRLTEPVQLIASGFAMSLFSQTAVLLRDHPIERARRFLGKYCLMGFGFASVISVLMAVSVPVIVPIALPEYQNAIPVFVLLAASLVFRTLNVSLTSYIQACGYFSRITILASWNLGLITALLFILVPIFGIVGAAMALLLGEILNTCVQLFIVVRIKSPKVNMFQSAVS